MLEIKVEIFLFKKMHILYTSPYRYKHPYLQKISRPENSANYEKDSKDQNKDKYQNYD